MHQKSSEDGFLFPPNTSGLSGLPLTARFAFLEVMSHNYRAYATARFSRMTVMRI